MLDKLKSNLRLETLKIFYKKNERLLIPGALLLGFITDILTFRFINFDLAILALLGHLIFSGASIVIINLYEDKIVSGKFFGYARLIAPLIIQYTFGALFSAFLIFYSHIGSIYASWPFILVLIFLMIANEIFRKYNTRPDIQLIVYFFAVFSFANLSIPYLLRDIGKDIFLGGGVLSLAFIAVFGSFLSRNIPRVKLVEKRIIAGVLAIFIFMNAFYFLNLIPPIPLSLKDVGIYYGVSRDVDGNYVLVDREKSFFERFKLRENFYITNQNDASAFSSVFAPADMRIDIVHEWQFLDQQRGWVTKSKIPFSIIGGRGDGFRGFSKTYQIEPGKWRLNVRTDSGQIIGRKIFRVIVVESLPNLIFKIK